jgi:hypothetical protein
MKKLLYILVVIVVLGSSMVSCTDENVQPTSQNNPGGTMLDPK